MSIHRPPLSVAECSRAVETLLFVPLCRAHFACSACMHAIYALLCAAACPVALSSVPRARPVLLQLQFRLKALLCCRRALALPLQLELEAVAVRPEGTVSGKAAPLWAWSRDQS